MLPKQAKFDLKCCKMRWRLGRSLRHSPKPPNRVKTPPITNSWLRHWLGFSLVQLEVYVSSKFQLCTYRPTSSVSYLFCSVSI